MLEVRAHCERCEVALEVDGEATICSFECTFCLDCATSVRSSCPNCGGELVRRPRRTTSDSWSRSPVRSITGSTLEGARKVHRI